MNSIKKNLMYNVGYQILTIILPLVTAPYISRALGANALGVYSYTYSVAYYFQIVAMLGISNHGNRSVAAVRDDKQTLSKTFVNIYTIQFVTYIIATILYVTYVLATANENIMISLLQTVYIISGLLDISWLYFGLEQFKLTVVRNVIIKIATVVCIFLFVKQASDLWKYTIIMSVGTLMSQSYLWLFLRKYIRFCKPSFREIKRNIEPILVLFIPVLAYSIYKVMDKIMIGNMSTYDQVGFYQNAEKIVNIPMGIITALGTVMLPRMANLIAAGDDKQSLTYIRLSIKLITALSSAIAFGLIGISSVFAPVFYGKEFEPCGDIIEALAITVFFIGWANVIRTQFLIPKRQDFVYLISTSGGALVNLIINLLLIPQYAAAGAAIGTVVAEFSVMTIQIIFTRKSLPVAKYILEDWPILLIGAVMMIIVKMVGGVFGESILSLTIQIAVGAVIFTLGTVIYWKSSGDELGKMAFRLLPRIKK